MSFPEIETAEPIVSDLVASLLPKTGMVEDYDFRVALNDESTGFLGVEGKDLKVTGSGRLVE